MEQKSGIFILIAGPNASGKTTVIKPKYVEGRVKHYLDPDRVLSIPRKDILSQIALKAYEMKSSPRLARSCMADWLASEQIRNEGIATESNLVTTRDFKIFKIAKAARMQTELYFVGISLDTALQREQIRADKGEQEKINEDDIIRRYVNGIANIKNHIESGNVDLIKVYDNSRSKGEEQLLLHIEKGDTIFYHPNPPEWFRNTNCI